MGELGAPLNKGRIKGSRNQSSSSTGLKEDRDAAVQGQPMGAAPPAVPGELQRSWSSMFCALMLCSVSNSVVPAGTSLFSQPDFC